MLKPLEALAENAAKRGMSERALRHHEEAMLEALLNPHEDSFGGIAETVEVFAHGPTATRVLRSAPGHNPGGRPFYLYYVQLWQPLDRRWVDKEDDIGDATAFQDDAAAALAMAKALSGPSLSVHDLEHKWPVTHDLKGVEAICNTRAKLAEFWYDVRGAESKDWGLLVAVADLAFRHHGVPPEQWDEPTRAQAQTALATLRVTWGEIQPPAKKIEDGPHYLATLFVENTPIRATDGRPSRYEAGARSWVTGEKLREVAETYGIDRASSASPGAAEYIWWYSSVPTKDIDQRTTYQLHVHEISDGADGAREPVAADYQSIANIIGVEFDHPMALPENEVSSSL